MSSSAQPLQEDSVAFFTNIGTMAAAIFEKSDVHSSRISAYSDRVVAVRDAFKLLYGKEPMLISRAPGRVNLIGEHIDYEGYAVLPMAIHLDTLVAISCARTPSTGTPACKEDSPFPPRLRVANMDPVKYPATEFSIHAKQEVDTSNHSWGSYFLCGYKGVWDHVHETGGREEPTLGLDVLVDGCVPLGSGLSSSAALVCSAAIAVMAALGFSFPKAEIADLACRCERYIGTQSGGMDQAISIFGERGVAQLIEFNPVRAHPVPLPSTAVFVIANSLAVSKKAETAATNYNRRVVECRLAAMVLAVRLGMEPATARTSISTLADVDALCAASSASPQPPDEHAALDAVRRCLHADPYSASEIEALLQAPLASVFANSPTSLAVIAAATEFKLQQRALHVYAEAHRVFAFRDAALSAPSDSSAPALSAAPSVLLSLGRLMDDSHASCRDLYECSSPELEQLVACCKAHGALGARLTGAGWGGCVVALVHAHETDSFLAHLKEDFYAPKIAAGTITAADLPNCVFASHPAAGAALLRL
ncbi:unnamed protein product [Closterium sp. Yama58-4]|nr:unnamed protein product [Closterium sp. Yama58-4]